IPTLSEEQARKLLEAAEADRLGALYVLALTTGMRRGEILALRWRDVDLERGDLHGSSDPCISAELASSRGLAGQAA
ncbi:MAG: tyrosine-type recombinase/integrase, partial [Chloroflexota bacterium]